LFASLSVGFTEQICLGQQPNLHIGQIVHRCIAFDVTSAVTSTACEFHDRLDVLCVRIDVMLVLDPITQTAGTVFLDSERVAGLVKR
jgi:hypothetical protein